MIKCQMSNVAMFTFFKIEVILKHDVSSKNFLILLENSSPESRKVMKIGEKFVINCCVTVYNIYSRDFCTFLQQAQTMNVQWIGNKVESLIMEIANDWRLHWGKILYVWQ